MSQFGYDSCCELSQVLFSVYLDPVLPFTIDSPVVLVSVVIVALPAVVVSVVIVALPVVEVSVVMIALPVKWLLPYLSSGMGSMPIVIVSFI